MTHCYSPQQMFEKFSRQPQFTLQLVCEGRVMFVFRWSLRFYFGSSIQNV